MSQNTCKARNINTFKRFQDMTRILFVCHGVIFTESDEGVISFIVQVPSVFA